MYIGIYAYGIVTISYVWSLWTRLTVSLTLFAMPFHLPRGMEAPRAFHLERVWHVLSGSWYRWSGSGACGSHRVLVPRLLDSL
jgi:hypothetical protein